MSPDKMKKLRKAQKLSQRKLAELSGVSNSTISRYEAEKGDIHQRKLDAISAVLSPGGEPSESVDRVKIRLVIRELEAILESEGE